MPEADGQVRINVALDASLIDKAINKLQNALVRKPGGGDNWEAVFSKEDYHTNEKLHFAPEAIATIYRIAMPDTAPGAYVDVEYHLETYRSDGQTFVGVHDKPVKGFITGNVFTKTGGTWLAQWGGSDEPSYSCGIWQYSETGKIDGIDGNVDLNFAYKDYPYVMKRDGLNGFKRSGSDSEPQYFEYKVQKGDVLWNLAKKYLGDGNRYKEIKSLNNLSSDTIYAGKILKIPK